MKKEIIKKISNQILLANKLAISKCNKIDKGSFNHDTLIYNFTGFNKKELDFFELESGFNVGPKIDGFKNYRFIFIDIEDSNCKKRTDIVEKTAEILRASGCDCMVWYNLD